MNDPTPARATTEPPNATEETHATAARALLEGAIDETIDPEAALRGIRRHLVMIYGERAWTDTRRGAA